MVKNKRINVKGVEVTVSLQLVEDNDFICLTDLAKAKGGRSRAADIIKNWIRTRTTLEFLGTWEQLNNSGFNVVEFDHFKMYAGLPSFVLSPGQWIERTNAKGLIVKSGRYVGRVSPKASGWNNLTRLPSHK